MKFTEGKKIFYLEKFVADLHTHRDKLKKLHPELATSKYIASLVGLHHDRVNDIFNSKISMPNIDTFAHLCFWMDRDPANYLIAPEWASEEIKSLGNRQEQKLSMAEKQQVELFNTLAIESATFGYAKSHLSMGEILKGIELLVNNFFIQHKINHHELVRTTDQLQKVPGGPTPSGVHETRGKDTQAPTTEAPLYSDSERTQRAPEGNGS